MNFAKKFPLLLMGLAVMFLAACEGEVGGTKDVAEKETASGQNSVATAVRHSAPVSECPNGGITVDIGIDSNGNGALDLAEVKKTEYVCNGAPGATGPAGPAGSWYSTAPAPLDSCPNGGIKVETGIDSNGNGKLDASEVQNSQYVCNGAGGAGPKGDKGDAGTNGSDGRNSLTALITEPSGTNCSAGGVKITSGLDVNNNGVLDAGEEGAPVYVCGVTGGGGGDRTVRVRVANMEDDSRIAGATVVLGDSTGALVATGITDADGEVIFTNAPANATITSAVSLASPLDPEQTIYSLHTLYDVNVSAVTIDHWRSSESLGAASMSVTNTLGADYWTIAPGEGWGDAVSNPTTVAVSNGDIQTDGKVSFAALGYDAADNLIGYGILLDQAFTPGMNIAIDLNQTVTSTITASLSNLPSSVSITYAWFDLDARRKGGSRVGTAYSTFSHTTSLTVPVISGFGDEFDYSVTIGIDQISSEWAYFGLWKNEASAEDFTLDFTMVPPIPQNIQIANTGTARPTLSWTGNDPSSDGIWMSLTCWSDTSSYDYILDASPGRTSAVFPELPASLASFRPTACASYDLFVTNQDISAITGYDGSLTFLDQAYDGTQSLTGTSVLWSGSLYLEPTALAPALKKAQALGTTSAGKIKRRFMR